MMRAKKASKILGNVALYAFGFSVFWWGASQALPTLSPLDTAALTALGLAWVGLLYLLFGTIAMGLTAVCKLVWRVVCRVMPQNNRGGDDDTYY